VAAPVEIAVFGSSEPGPGDPRYERARALGRALARAGYGVVTGGYGGVMEAASRGAREAGGTATGVVCGDLFSGRVPNPWLTESVSTPDLFERTRELVRRARGFVVLGGKAGTLAELAFLWALNRAGCLADRPVILLTGPSGEPWNALMTCLEHSDLLDPSELAATEIVASPGAAVRRLVERIAPGSA
jgi:uncharacterized protein (TIGR00730 family)